MQKEMAGWLENCQFKFSTCIKRNKTIGRLEIYHFKLSGGGAKGKITWTANSIVLNIRTTAKEMYAVFYHPDFGTFNFPCLLS
jgi:hypothetical protein